MKVKLEMGNPNKEPIKIAVPSIGEGYWVKIEKQSKALEIAIEALRYQAVPYSDTEQYLFQDTVYRVNLARQAFAKIQEALK